MTSVNGPTEPVVIALEGEVSFLQLVPLRARLWEPLRTHAHPRVVVDLSRVSTFSTPGLGMLVEYHKAVAAKGGRVAFVKPNPRVWEVVQKTRLDQILTVADDLTGALARTIA